MPSKLTTGPRRSPTVRVIVNTDKGRITYELTQAKVRALTSTTETGFVSDLTPLATARSLVRDKLLKQVGPRWEITSLGVRVRSRLPGRQPVQRG